MRTIFYIIQKEFLQIKRNHTMLPLILVVPIVQLIILVNAATYEMKNVRIIITDNDRSSYSYRLSSKFQGSEFFILEGYLEPGRRQTEAIQKNRADVIIDIPKDFEKNLINQKKSSIQLNINAINSMAAGLSSAYSISVINDFSREISQKSGLSFNNPIISIKTNYRHWYNPELNYKNFMVPGVLVLLITIIGLLLSGMNIVREKEMGTIEQINVTPIRKYQFIIGKLTPFWIIGMFELAFGMFIGKLLYDIPIEGSFVLIFVSASIYLFVILGMGLFISTLANTQQQSMFITFFFIMMFNIMSGLFTAVENMPIWAQYLNKVNPIAYFIRIMRMVLLKGSDFFDILPELLSLSLLAIIMLTLSVRRYRKVS